MRIPGCLSCNSASGDLESASRRAWGSHILTMRAGVEESFALNDQALNLGIIGVYSVNVRRSMG